MGIHASAIRKTAKLTSNSGSLDIDLTQTFTFSDLRGTLGANLAAGGFKITGLGTPSAATDSATKGYVDGLINSLAWKDNVRLATAAALAACTYDNGTSGVGATLTADANGALSIDGVAVAADDRVLIKNQASGLQNGIYTVTQTGSAGAPFILTRTTDADSEAKLTSMVVQVDLGTTNADTSWYTATTITTLGTTAISYSSFATPLTEGNGINISAGVVSVEVDDSTLNFNGTTLRVKPLGIAPASMQFKFASVQKVSADFAFGSNLSTLTLSAAIDSTAAAWAGGLNRLICDGIEAFPTTGTVFKYATGGAPAADGEWRVNGTTLQIYGDVTGTSSTFNITYPIANS